MSSNKSEIQKLEYSKRQQLRLLIAQQLERDEEKNYFRSDGAHLYASPAFFACHRWEDEVNEITKASGQAPIYIENWVDAAGRPKKFTVKSPPIVRVIECLYVEYCSSSSVISSLLRPRCSSYHQPSCLTANVLEIVGKRTAVPT